MWHSRRRSLSGLPSLDLGAPCSTVHPEWTPHPSELKIYVYDLPQHVAYMRPLGDHWCVGAARRGMRGGAWSRPRPNCKWCLRAWHMVMRSRHNTFRLPVLMGGKPEVPTR